MKVFRYNELNENKMWYKSIPEILEWLELKSELPWIFIDTETTGLGGPSKQQLTQISAISNRYNFDRNSFDEIERFDEKIKLTSKTKSIYNDPKDITKKILSFNHYGSGNYRYKDEKYVIDEFFKWMNSYTPCLMIAQNAGFDMKMIGGRYNNKIKNEVIDTKMVNQLYYLPLLQTLAEKDSKYQVIIDTIGTSTRDNGLISSSMGRIGPSLGINMSGYHDALTDVGITIQMFQKIIGILKQNKNIDISRYQIERIKSLRKDGKSFINRI